MGLIRHLQNNQTIPIVDIINGRGYSLLHEICFKNLEEFAKAVIDMAV